MYLYQIQILRIILSDLQSNEFFHRVDIFKQMEFQFPTFQDFFKGKRILLTGCTGFVGKGVLEKILRQYDTGMIYVMIRAQNNITASERFRKQICQSKCFERLRQEKGENFQEFIINRTTPIHGDFCENELGIEKHVRDELQDRVHIIINCAASIELHLPLKQALDINFYGNLKMMQLAVGCKRLNMLIHISTAYVNANRKGQIQEQIYDEKQNILNYVQDIYQQADKMSEAQVDKLLNDLGSTYIFAKNLAEQMYKQLKPKNMSLSIIRPSCVGCAISEPQPGWIDNLAVQGGLILNTGLGLLKLFKCDKTIQICTIPIDIFVDQIIGVAGYDSNQQKFKIYHSGCSYDNPNFEFFKLLETKGIDFWMKYQAKKRVAPPKVILTNNNLYYKLKYQQLKWMLYLGLKIAENVGSYESIKQAKLNLNNLEKSNKISKVFQSVSSKQWIFQSSNMRMIIDYLGQFKELNMDVRGIYWKQYFYLYNYGVQKFVLGEKINLKDIIMEDQFNEPKSKNLTQREKPKL
ncbi:hypothetical protein pb186bvf_009964 [Paramecium bursaria]